MSCIPCAVDHPKDGVAQFDTAGAWLALALDRRNSGPGIARAMDAQSNLIQTARKNLPAGPEVPSDPHRLRDSVIALGRAF